MIDLKYDQKIDLTALKNLKIEMDYFLKEIKNLTNNNFRQIK